jgi:alanine dehydrogenase
VHFEQDTDDPSRCYMLRGTSRIPLSAFLAEYDIVVNCVLQDTDTPLMFVTTAELASFTPGSLIVDVSCDEGMGFSWARPTSFAEPMVTVGDNVHYYAVDHSPSYLWNSATWEISEALLPHLLPVLTDPQAWEANETIQRAIEIRDGVIRNPRILSFQHRSPDYPHLHERQ